VTWIDKLSELSVVGSYSKLGYQRREQSFAPLAADLEGRVVVVTGATSGIGFAAAERLASLGARVVAVGRSADKLAAAARALGPDVATERADLSDLEQTRALADRLGERYGALYALVHNAGLLPHERQLTPQGHERAFATHVLAPFVLTQRLRPALRAAAPARVVWVSSGGMYAQRLDLERCQAKRGRYDGVEAYAQQKRAQVILNELFAARLSPEGIASHAMHPGWVDTPGVRTSLPRFYRLMRPLLRDVHEGADTLVWLVAAPGLDEQAGRFWLDRQPRKTEVLPGTRHSHEEKQALWTLCEQRCAPFL
jgi:dehydrogenase/reductase SDR family member 12